MHICKHEYNDQSGLLTYGCEVHVLSVWKNIAEEMAKKYHKDDWEFSKDLVLSLVDLYANGNAIPDSLRTRAIAAGGGYWFARDVDMCPRDDTREAAILEGHGFYYARDIDKCSRDDTRQAAIQEGTGYGYAIYVDNIPINEVSFNDFPDVWWENAKKKINVA